jgi:hypothetical protein
VADDHHRAASVVPGDVGQARDGPVPDRRPRLDTRRVIDRAEPFDHRFPAGARALPVVPVDQPLVGRCLQPRVLGHRLRGLHGPAQRAGDDGRRVAPTQRGPQPPGLIASSVVELRVGQAPKDIGLVERRLTVPGQVDQSPAGPQPRMVWVHDGIRRA